ncbi:MAG: ATP-dependent zinc metalloprotease FtsH [Terriglobia bacterium]
MSLILMFVMFGLLAFAFSSAFRKSQKPISYTQFKKDVAQGKVAQVLMKGKEVTVVYKQSKSQAKQKVPPKVFKTVLPPISDPDLMKLLEKNGVTMTAAPPSSSSWTDILIDVLPWILIIGAFVYFSRGMKMPGGGGASSIFGFGKSKAKRYFKGPSDVTFNDVAGLENAKRELMEIVEYLRDPQRYQRIGAKLPRGTLLMGPPGTGKTLLARAVAGEANVPFFSISGSEFVEMFVGVGASRVRDLFDTAKKESPAVIFIDEIDSVGRSRGTGVGGGNDEREQTLNQILSEMDGFSPWLAVVVIAATNRPDVLDPALLRPGRFDRKITMELPQKDARRRILQIHSRHVPLAEDADLETMARRTVGFSGADLQNLINEAALLAGREKKDQVSMDYLERALDRIALGARRELRLTETERRRVAFHESGHALLAWLLPNTDPLEKVTIIPRGRALGATEQIPEVERYNLSESYLRDRIAVMLGGRVSEKLVFGEVSSGAENDLQQATNLARHMVSRWGMNEHIGPAAFPREADHPFLGRAIAQPSNFSEHTARLIDDEVRALIGRLQDDARKLLGQHRLQLDALGERLLERETLEGPEIRQLLVSLSTEALEAGENAPGVSHG